MLGALPPLSAHFFVAWCSGPVYIGKYSTRAEIQCKCSVAFSTRTDFRFSDFISFLPTPYDVKFVGYSIGTWPENKLECDDSVDQYVSVS
jgi:hypothetical protein